jgi:predicted Zn-dependent protease
MTNWKAVTIAMGLALGWLIGDPAIAMGPGPDAQAQVQLAVSHVESLLAHLREHPADVSALEQLAATYAANESYDAAIGPLARALQLDPKRRSLWVALDRAVQRSGAARITDAELSRRAASFVEVLER